MLSIKIPHDSETSRKILRALQIRKQQSEKSQSNRKNKWRESEDLFVGYIHETEQDRLRKTKRRDAGKPDYTTISLPYSYAVAMTAYSYWATVFLARSPVLQFQGTTGEGEDQVLALEALAQYQMIRGRMLPNLYVWLQDAPKYGEAWVSPYWKTVTTRTSEIVMQEEMYMNTLPTGNMKPVRVVKDIVGYQGNALNNVSPAKVFTDPRLPRTRFQEGEYIAIEITLAPGMMLKGQAEGRYINIDKLMGLKTSQGMTGTDTGMYPMNTDAESAGMERPDVNAITSGLDPTIMNAVDGNEFVINIIPKAWGLGSGDMPEKWVFTCDKDFSVLVEARPFGCLHDKFPLALMEIEAEGYGMFSRSLMEIFNPVQQTLDWLVNSHFYNVRQSMNGQFVLDPSMVEEKDFQGEDPGLGIRLKPAAYGQDVRKAVSQLPVMDMTRGHFADIQFMYDMGERLGVSDSMSGITNPSSRRTAQEIRGDQAFTVNKLKTMAEYFSCTGWADFADMTIQNSQQYYDGQLKLKIVGELANFAGAGFVTVSPEDIVGQYNFVPVDGTMPIDRYAQANMWRQTIMDMANVPQVFQMYDLGKIFSYVAQLGGIKNLDRFKVQLVPDDMARMQAQAGNLIPAGGGNNAMGNPVEPGQVPGNGPTA